MKCVKKIKICDLKNVNSCFQEIMSEFLKESMNKISLEEFEVINTSHLGYAGVYGGTTKGWDVKEEEKKIKIKIQSMDNTDMEFDLIGFEPGMPNAFRRILLSEIPSMAIEKVHIYQNTSIMQVSYILQLSVGTKLQLRITLN